MCYKIYRKRFLTESIYDPEELGGLLFDDSPYADPASVPSTSWPSANRLLFGQDRVYRYLAMKRWHLCGTEQLESP